MKHIIVSLSWQSDYWQEGLVKEDRAVATHKYVKEGNLPHELWNFNFEKTVENGYKIGFFQATSSEYDNGKAIVFFYSKNYIVGLYAKAEIGSFPVAEEFVNNEQFIGKVRAPLDLCVRWKDQKILPVNKSRHFNGQEKMGQSGVIKIQDEQAKNIIHDAIAAHNDAPEIQSQLRKVYQAVFGAKETQEMPPTEETCVFTKKLIDITDRTHNIILYGPPGTGKTYSARKFAEQFLTPQTEAVASNEQIAIKAIGHLKWYEAIALAMYKNDTGSQMTIKQIIQTELIRNYALYKNSHDSNASVRAELRNHCIAECKEIKSASRRSPLIFDWVKSGTWRLTDEGEEYVKEQLEDQLDALAPQHEVHGSITDYCRFVTFHQSYAYEEFVEGLKPILADDADESPDQIHYDVVPGVFTTICQEARIAYEAHGDNAPKYLLVIDEINRANIAKVLGELITLLEDDKRLGQPNELRVTLPYSGKELGIPPNLYIMGTMNTADRSIALLDIALRRRFTFVEIMPDPTLLKTIAGVDLGALLFKLNKRIRALLDRDQQVGHSYFMKVKTLEDLRFAWYHQIVPLLQEYFYNDTERLKAVLGQSFVEESQPDSDLFESATDLIDLDSPRVEIATFEEDDEGFIEALLALAGTAE